MTDKEVAKVHGKIVARLEKTLGAKLLVSGSAGYLKGKVYPAETKLWDLATGKELAKLIGGRVSVNVLEFSPDGKRLAVGYYGRAAKLWDVASGKDLATFEHTTSVHGLTFSPDGKLLATGCAQGTIRVWKTGAGP